MRFSMMGSGSKGNATLVEAGGVRVLVDCGFTVVEMQKRAERLGFDLASLDAILVTHEHGDHMSGVAKLAKAYALPVYLTQGSCVIWPKRDVAEINIISPHQSFAIGALQVQPIAVPHDAREPCQFAFIHNGKKLGVLSDLGWVTAHVQTVLYDCDALLLECNHDEEMLANGPYTRALKKRVAGNWGHLSNRQSAGLAATLEKGRLQHLALTHLSEKNNTPALARAAICEAIQDDPEWCVCAQQVEGLGWREIA